MNIDEFTGPGMPVWSDEHLSGPGCYYAYPLYFEDGSYLPRSEWGDNPLLTLATAFIPLDQDASQQIDDRFMCFLRDVTHCPQ